MPKYTPTSDDMYNTRPCFICGRDVLDENRDTCCQLCKDQKTAFEEDLQWFFLQDNLMMGE